MPRKRIIFFLLLIGIGISPVVAQQITTETKQARFRIDYVYTRNDSLMVMVGAGKTAGIQPGLLLKCFSAFKTVNGKEQSSAEIGYGKVIGSDSNHTLCLVTLYDKKQAIEEGDHVLMNISLPVLPFESLLYEACLNGIQFVDVNKEPFFNLNHFMVSVSKPLEDSIKNQMVRDLHRTYELIKDRQNLPPSMSRVMDKGRFRGKTALQVLRDASVTDLNNFLLYVKNYPAKYTGNLFRISESMTGWVVSNSPYSAEEVKLAMMPWLRNKAEFSKRIKEYRESILEEGHSVSFGEEAVALAGRNKTTEADRLLQLAIMVADEVKDTVGKASALLSGAQILQEKEKYKEAIAECDKVIAVAGLCKDSRNKIYSECRRYELAAVVKKGYCQYTISLYKEGINTLAYAAMLTKKYEAIASRENYYYYLQKIYEYTGWINYTSGDYTKAIGNFENAIKINDTINTYDSRNKNADYYKRIGKVYREQGNYRPALEFYTAAEDIYKGLNDRRNELFTEVDKGEVYYYSSEYDKSLRLLADGERGLIALKEFDYAGYAASLRGSVYYMTGKYDSAILAHHTSIGLKRKSESIAGQGWSWRQLGELYLLSGRKKDALAAYDSSNAFYSRIPDKAGIAGNYNSIGKVYLNDENFKKAAEYFEKAKADSKTPVEALYNLSNAWMLLDTVKARNYLLECKKMSHDAGNDLYKYYAVIDLAKLAYRNNNFGEGDRYYDSAAIMAKNFATPYAEAQRLDLEAYAHIYKLEIDSAISAYRRSVTTFDTVNQHSAVWERISLADALISKGEFKEAEAVLLRGTGIADSSSYLLPLGVSYSSHSFLYSLLGEIEKGMKANERASAIYNETGNNFRQAGALMSKGTLYKTSGDFRRSIEALLAADSIYRAEKTEEMRGAVLINIGVTYFNQGDYAKSVEYFTRSEKFLKAGLIDETYLLNKGNIAECYYYLGKLKEAEKILLLAFPVAKRKEFNRIASGMAVTLGKIYFDEKQLAKARQYLDTAVIICQQSSEKEKMVDALVMLAKVKSAEGNDAGAEDHLGKAVEISREYYIPAFSWIAFYESGLLSYRQKKFEKAIADFKSAVEIVEKNSSNIYGGDEAKKIYRNDPRKVDLYGKLVVALAESGKSADAWAYANRSNITGIKELMGSMAAKTGDASKDEALEKAKTLSQKTETLARKEAELKAQPQTEQVTAQLQSIGQEKEIAEKDFIKYSENLFAKYPDLKDNFYDNVNPVDFENYKGILPADMAVLLYVINDNKLLIFSLTNEKLGITPVDLKEDITRTIREYSALLRMPGKATGTGRINVRSTIEGDEDNIDISKLSFKDVSEKLYRLLITPVGSNIQGKKKLCIIPNGDLGNIPFQALGYKSGEDFRFLVEEQVIFYTSRMKIFDTDPPVTSNISSFAVFGVPDQTLKYTEKEAKSIAGIMNITDAVYTEKKATEQQAKLSLAQKKYVHFATHGILNYTDYNASYLKFLPAMDTTGGNNGKLTIDEIYGLNIGGCELVTLSACETAVSRQKTKGWKISPANSLLRKRVKSVIATMWKVDDEATSILMDEFYRQLNDKKEKAEALRMAQEKLSKDARYSHPYFWSAFVLYGDWR